MLEFAGVRRGSENKLPTTSEVASATVREEIAVARGHEDLCGDGKELGGGSQGLPAELQHPELFHMDEVTRQMLLKVMAEQQQGQPPS